MNQEAGLSPNQPPVLWEINSVVCKLPSPWYFVITARMESDREQDIGMTVDTESRGPRNLLLWTSCGLKNCSQLTFLPICQDSCVDKCG